MREYYKVQYVDDGWPSVEESYLFSVSSHRKDDGRYCQYRSSFTVYLNAEVGFKWRISYNINNDGTITAPMYAHYPEDYAGNKRLILEPMTDNDIFIAKLSGRLPCTT